jgi:hypothetical protein
MPSFVLGWRNYFGILDSQIRIYLVCRIAEIRSPIHNIFYLTIKYPQYVLNRISGNREF